MKILKQLALLFLCCTAGGLLSLLFRGKLPGNVLGMILLLVLLLGGLVKLHHVETAADFFLANMAFFFIPALLGILEVYPVIQPYIIQILAVVFISTLLTAAVTASVVHLTLKVQGRKGARHE